MSVRNSWKVSENRRLYGQTRISLALVHYNFFLCAFSLFLGISEFQGLVGSFIGTVDSLAKLVEKEKMKVINLYKSMIMMRNFLSLNCV